MHSQNDPAAGNTPQTEGLTTPQTQFDGRAGGAPLSPCTPMRTLLSRLADGTLSSGPAHWVVSRHIEHCPGCAEALAALQLLSHRLRALGHADFADAAVVSVAALHRQGKNAPDALALSPDRWDAVLVAWQNADAIDPA